MGEGSVRGVPLRVISGLVAIAVAVGGSARANEVLFWVFEQYLEALRRNAGIPGLAAALVGEEGIVWERGLGFQDVENAVPTRPDTPFHLSGLVQLVTATLTLRCVEEGRLRLDDRVGQFDPQSPDAGSSLRQVLTHTRPSPSGLEFAYQRHRYAPLAAAVAACAGKPFRDRVAEWFDRLGMADSVPGPDAVAIEELGDETRRDRYRAVLERLARPYRVDHRAQPVRSTYPAVTLSAFDGAISTVRDLARFDLALRGGVLLNRDTLVAAWRAPLDEAGLPLPHGLGWFVQRYRGELVVWQMGVAEQASSSLMVTLPQRQLTFIALANSDGLVAPFPLAAGDLTVSPVGRLVLGMFIGR
jgi:CubicO group peptidase (beta-lactamase class C family)